MLGEEMEIVSVKLGFGFERRLRKVNNNNKTKKGKFDEIKEGRKRKRK